jgi:hypothetical protein
LSADDTTFISNEELLATAADGTWHALEQIKTGVVTVSTINVDGTRTIGLVNFGTSVSNFYLGIFPDGMSSPFNGKMAEFGIWSGAAFSPSQQASICSNIQAYWSTPACAAPSTYAGPGDIVSGATFWGGLRCYAAANAGVNAIRVRRASDNTEQDVALTAGCGLTDVSATFCAATTCFVKTLYDQSGSGNDATQATSAAQPQLTFSCIGALPCITFAGAQFLVVTASTIASPFTNSAVAFRGIGGPSGIIMNVDLSTGVGDQEGFLGADQVYIGNSDVVATATDGTWHALQAILVSNGDGDATLNVDDVKTTGPLAFGVGGTGIAIGAFVDLIEGFLTGKVTEVGSWSATTFAEQPSGIRAQKN